MRSPLVVRSSRTFCHRRSSNPYPGILSRRNAAKGRLRCSPILRASSFFPPELRPAEQEFFGRDRTVFAAPLSLLAVRARGWSSPIARSPLRALFAPLWHGYKPRFGGAHRRVRGQSWHLWPAPRARPSFHARRPPPSFGREVACR